MTAQVSRLVQHLQRLQQVSYEDRAAARAHDATSHAALLLIYDLGRQQVAFTEDQKRTVATNLATALRPLQVNIQNHAFEFRPNLNVVLKKRSALQFLVDNYSQLPVKNRTLSDVFKELVLEETIQILNGIIEKNREYSDDEELAKQYMDEFGLDYEPCRREPGILSSHSWWP